MAIVHINLEDTPDGLISLVADYVGGFDVSSHAHQHAYQLIKTMDTIAQRAEEPLVTVSPLEEINNGIARAEGHPVRYH